MLSGKISVRLEKIQMAGEAEKKFGIKLAENN